MYILEQTAFLWFNPLWTNTISEMCLAVFDQTAIPCFQETISSLLACTGILSCHQQLIAMCSSVSFSD
jgi:hypothetical protein